MLEPGGLPLDFLNEEGGEANPPGGETVAGAAAAAGGGEKAPLDGVSLAVGGAGTKANDIDPSGPYFLGLPLLRFRGSPPLLIFMFRLCGKAAEPSAAPPYGGDDPEERDWYTGVPSAL